MGVGLPGTPEHEQYLTGVDMRGYEDAQNIPTNMNMGSVSTGLTESHGSVVNNIGFVDGLTQGEHAMQNAMTGLEPARILQTFGSVFGYDFAGNKNDSQGGMDSLEGVPIIGLPAVLADERLYREPDMSDTGIPGDEHALIPAENEMDDR
jgi:hypothetical protein